MNIILMPVRAGIRDTQVAIESCLQQTMDDICILTIDDASQDCSHYLRSLRGPFIQITYSRPHGLNHAWNEGLRWAFNKMRQPHVLVINNDVQLRTDTYQTLVDDGGGFVTGVGVKDLADTNHINASSRSPHPDFSCFLIRKQVWDKVGEFDETFWAWASDCDYHVRMNQAGIEAYALDLPFHHRGGGSSTLRNVNQELHLELCRLSDRDRQTFHRKWGCEVGSDQYYAMFREVCPSSQD